MYNLCRILQHVVNGFDNVSLAQHHSVIEWHQLVFHVYAQPCQQLYSILKEEVKQLLRNIAFVSEQLAIQTFSKNLEHIRVLVADICTSKYEGYYLASVITRKVELKPKSVISIFSIMEQFDYIFYYFALQGFHIPLFSSK